MVTPREQVTNALNAFTEKLIVKIVVNATAEIAELTPVDTGWARANWIPQLDSPAAGTAGTREAAENGVIDLGRQSSGLAQVVSGYKLPKKAFITNNVQYIIDLNDGSSKKAPSGFIKTGIALAIRKTLKS